MRPPGRRSPSRSKGVIRKKNQQEYCPRIACETIKVPIPANSCSSAVEPCEKDYSAALILIITFILSMVRSFTMGSTRALHRRVSTDSIAGSFQVMVKSYNNGVTDGVTYHRSQEQASNAPLFIQPLGTIG